MIGLRKDKIMPKKCFECEHEKSKVCVFEKQQENHKSISDIFDTPVWCPLFKNDVNITHFYRGVLTRRGKVHFCKELVDRENLYKQTYCKSDDYAYMYGTQDIQRIEQDVHLMNYCKSCLNKLEYGYDYKRKAIWLYNGKFYEGWVGLVEELYNDDGIIKNLNVDLFPIRIVTMGLIEKFKKKSDDYMNLKKFVDVHHLDIQTKSYNIWIKKEFLNER